MIALLLLACMPMVTPDEVGSPGLVDTAGLDSGQPAYGQTVAVISTLADDYSVGAVATVDLNSLALSDTLSPTAGDAVVKTVDERVAVLNRLNTDTLQLFEPSDWLAPVLDLALPDLSNPQDAAWCGDRLWVSLHTADHLPAYDRLGRRTLKADLSEWSGTDGAAEAVGMRVHEGALFVALEQFAQDEGWVSEGGVVVRVDCETAQVTQVLAAPPSPSIVAGPSEGTALVRTGLYGETDGVVMMLDLQTQQTEVLLMEEELDADITGAAIHGDTLVYLSADSSWNYSVHCMSLQTGEHQTAMTTASYLSDVQVDDRGRAWISARAGWSGESQTMPGLHLIDTGRCTSLLPAGEAIRPTLSPYNLSFL